MARRKNVKRIDPRYFLHETVNRGEECDDVVNEEEKDEEGYERPLEAGLAEEKDDDWIPPYEIHHHYDSRSHSRSILDLFVLHFFCVPLF